jgi:outer membrane autotransporter protein
MFVSHVMASATPTTKLRLAFLSGVSTAAAMLLPTSAAAQATACSQTGATITCVNGAATVLTATTTPSNATIAGSGLVTVDTTGPATTTYTATGPISTTGATAVNLTSTGGALSLTPAGAGAPVNVNVTGGVAANGVTLNALGQPATVTVGNIATSGTNSFGVLSTTGGDLTLRTGDINVTGANSTAIDAGAQTGNISTTAGNITATGRGIRTVSTTNGTNTAVVGNVVTGDRGILANGGTVSVTAGNVTTSTNGGTTPGGYGVAAQGFTGNVTVRTGAISTVNGSGIIANAFSPTGSVDVGGCPSVSTTGDNATAILGQAQGTGSVTVNCGALSTTGLNSNGVFATSVGGNTTVNITSATTSGVGSYGVTANTVGAGTVTTNAGVITTTGNGGTGLFSRAATGAIDAGYGNITTSGLAVGANSAAALDLASTGTINLRGNGATLRTNGAGVTAALVTGAGVTGNLGNVTTTGAGSQGAIITSSAPVNLTVGTVATTGNGLIVNAGTSAVTLTTGAVTATEAGATGTVVNTTGAVNFTGGRQAANGANALRITGGAGAINATVAGAATMGTGTAVAITGTGPVTFANSGTITTSGATSDGINIATPGTIGITGGQVATTGANSRGIVANGGGAVTVSATGVTTTGATANAIVANSATGSVGVSLSGANNSASLDGVSIAAATTANLALTSGTLTGLNNGATIASGTGTTVTNAGTIGGGNYALAITGGAATVNNSGTINGRMLLTANGDTVNNSGTFNANSNSDFGAGADVFNNSGTLRVLGQATTAGTVTLTGLETFNNSGLVDLRNGHVGDVLVLPGTYAGSGAARLGADVNLATFTGDQLRIGGAATGSTTVSIAAVNTTPAVLGNSTGALVVQAGAASSATAFTLDGASVDQGLIQYGIVYNPTTFAYSLVATPGVGVYRASLFAEGVRNLWLQSGDSWSGHMRELRDNIAANGPGGAGGRVWAQVLGQVEQRGSNRSFAFNGLTTPVDLSYKQDYFGGQMGVDLGVPAGEGGFAFGVTGGYLNSNLKFANSPDRINFDAVNGGVYASLNAGIFFINALGKYDYYWGDNVSVSGRYTQKLKGSIYGGKAEAGFRFGSKLWFEPAASVSYTHSDFGDFGGASGSFAFNDQDGVRGKGGARIGFTSDIGPAKMTLYGGGNYVHEFKGQDQVTFTSGGQTVAFGNQRLGDYGEGLLGLNIGSHQGAVSGFFEGRYADGGDYEGYGGRAGVRFRF